MQDDAKPAPADLPDFDPDRLTVEQSYEIYKDLQRRCPVLHSAARGGFHLLTRYQDVRAAATDWQTFSSANGVALRAEPTPRVPALEMDPPEHGPWRKLYMEAFTPQALQLAEPALVELTNGLIDEFAGGSSADLVRAFAQPLPVLGVCRMIGLEGRDPKQIRRLADAYTQTTADAQARKALYAQFGDFVLAELHSRRAQPREDYLTRIALAEFDGRRMDDETLVMAMLGFLVAGHETTTSALSSLLFHVLSKPHIKQRMLSDAKAMKAGIEEAVRMHSPFQGFSRTTTRPVEVAGVDIPAGKRVQLCYAAANRDAAMFENPEEFSLDRPPNQQLGFGFGRHVCAGAPLARLEMRIGLRELLRRLPDIRLTIEQLQFDLIGGIFAAPRALPVAFTPAGVDAAST